MSSIADSVHSEELSEGELYHIQASLPFTPLASSRPIFCFCHGLVEGVRDKNEDLAVFSDGGQNVFWPSHWLPDDFPQCGVIFSRTPVGRASSYSLVTVQTEAENLLSYLWLARVGQAGEALCAAILGPYRPVRSTRPPHCDDSHL